MTKKEQNLINLISEDETSFLLDKEIWEKYDITETKYRVKEFLREYKILRAIAVQSIANTPQNLNVKFDVTKVFNSVKPNNVGFSNLVDSKIDAEIFVKQTTPIINKVIDSFTSKERLYYEHCLSNNNSEDSLRKLLNEISKNGLKPIKSSCILKIAFAFELEVLK